MQSKEAPKVQVGDNIKQILWYQDSQRLYLWISNGYGKAIAFLDYSSSKEGAFIPDRQAHKYVNAVIDEETGKSMEYHNLLKDPKHRED